MSSALRYLLDTNVLSHAIRDPRGKVAQRLAGCNPESLCTSIVAAAELRFGAAKRGSAELSARVEAVLNVIEVLPIGEGADQHYAEIRWALERAGTPIGPNDLWIAAQARASGLCVVTANRSEFERVPQLQVDDWS